MAASSQKGMAPVKIPHTVRELSWRGLAVVPSPWAWRLYMKAPPPAGAGMEGAGGPRGGESPSTGLPPRVWWSGAGDVGPVGAARAPATVVAVEPSPATVVAVEPDPVPLVVVVAPPNAAAVVEVE